MSRGRIGVVIQEVTKELADSFGLPKAPGALVNSVEKGSPADKAGVEAVDVILSFDGKPVAVRPDLPRIVAQTRPGSEGQHGGLAQGQQRAKWRSPWASCRRTGWPNAPARRKRQARQCRSAASA